MIGANEILASQITGRILHPNRGGELARRAAIFSLETDILLASIGVNKRGLIEALPDFQFTNLKLTALRNEITVPYVFLSVFL